MVSAPWTQLGSIELPISAPGPEASAGDAKGTKVDLMKLFQAELAVLDAEAEARDSPSLVDSGGSLPPQEPVLPEPTRSLARREWLSAVTATRTSKLQKEVEAALLRAGYGALREHLTDDGLFSVDIMVTEAPDAVGADNVESSESAAGEGHHAVRSAMAALQVDGPTHFTACSLLRPLGATLLNRSLLSRRVPNLISVPFFEWDRLGGDPSRQVAYIKAVLREHTRR